MPKEIKSITDTLETMKEETQGDTIEMGELVEILNSRGYGPILLGPALIVVLPTGAIPIVPDICALIIIFISVQILFRKQHPWLPQRLMKFSFSRVKMLKAIRWAKPWAQRLDKIFYPRFKFLVRAEFKPFVAIISILLSFAIMVLGFIPFAAMLPALGIFFLALGLTARDGLLFILSFVICGASLASLPYAFSAIFSS